MKIRAWMQKIDWINTLFLATTPVIGFVGAYRWAVIHPVHYPTVILTVVTAVLTGMGVTAGYHRLFAHKSYDARPLARLALLLLGATSFENSALNWSSDHRKHHKYVDTDLDPYNIKRGFWYAHVGWICLKYGRDHAYDNVADLAQDPLIRFQDRY